MTAESMDMSAELKNLASQLCEQARADGHWDLWIKKLGIDEADLLKAVACSDFLHRTVSLRTDLLSEAVARLPLQSPSQRQRLEDLWQWFAASVESEAELGVALRRFRCVVQFRIIWRDLLGWADLEETLAAASDLAEIVIDGALDLLYGWTCDQFGTPFGRHPITGEHSPQPLIVLGMGKLGGRELNVSSDIDLIFAFPSNGETEGGRRAIDNQTFFNRLGQKLIQALDNITAEGFVHRVDMRLRPYGESGALCQSFSALETYYQDQGREWERYAMIKARVVAGDQEQGAVLMAMLRPFVFRRYIDFSAFESLRSMKAMINREVRRKGLENNIKLGRGGIRDIEFVVQAFQLIRGGRDTELQAREIYRALEAISSLELLPARVVKELRVAYDFLRKLEHALQGIDDEQTQLLPDTPLGCARVAWIMGFARWEDCLRAMNDYRSMVASHFGDIITEADSEDDSDLHDTWQEIWLDDVSPEEASPWLAEHGFSDPESVVGMLRQLRESRQVAGMQSEGRRRLNQFMPTLLSALTEVDNPSQTLQRLLVLVEAVLRRTAYLVLLNENPGACKQLVSLCSQSPWIAAQLADTPLLLDELLNETSLYNPPSRDELESELRQQMLRISPDDLEQQMEALRQFQKAHTLRIAASEVRGTLPLMKVSDYLTWIAEVVLNHVLVIAYNQLVRRHGYPEGVTADDWSGRFAIIGYGKLGGIELGYSSDLDLVFLHNCDPMGSTDGDKPVDNAVFFTRLGQRIVHILTAQTPTGQLYDVDMRLRPSGNSGLLVTTLSAFRKYQNEGAWTWEHQALVRARGIAGQADVMERFEQIRRDVLCASRPLEALRTDVIDMRERMLASLGSSARDAEVQFHVKHDPGGLVDLEFIAQFLVLAHASDYPVLTQWPDNIRQLEALGRVGLLEESEASALREAYIALRSSQHRRALQAEGDVSPGDAFAAEREVIARVWKRVISACE